MHKSEKQVGIFDKIFNEDSQHECKVLENIYDR
jgi:hypothetical protein